jgi:hypothetical protein
MLMPSALSCDGPQSILPGASQASPFASPPASPPTFSSQITIGNIMTSCRSLQSLMATPAPNPLTQIPTPPLSHAAPPMKLRLRPRSKSDRHNDEQNVGALGPKKRIVKRAPPRGANKRRRSVDDDMGREDSDFSESEAGASDTEADAQQPISSPQPPMPSTPKRARIAPEQIPLGLERSDFHDMHLREVASHGDLRSSYQEAQGTDVEREADGTRWSAEDDRLLVELVLDKLKLSKTEWQDCARSLGKDRHSLGRRWKSLISHGDVGLKRSSRRARLHSTWR